jgi:hypothetical protein
MVNLRRSSTSRGPCIVAEFLSDRKKNITESVATGAIRVPCVGDETKDDAHKTYREVG